VSYSDLSQDDLVLLAIQYTALGTDIPAEIVEILGEELIQEITNPIGDFSNERDNQ